MVQRSLAPIHQRMSVADNAAPLAADACAHEVKHMVSLRCPRCLAPIPSTALRCPVCGSDPRVAPALANGASALLAPRLTPSLPDRASTLQPLRNWLPLIGMAALLLAVLAGLAGAALFAASEGLGDVAWPALIAIAVVMVVGALLLVERRQRAFAQLTPTGNGRGATPSDLDLIHLFAAHFAPPDAGPDSFRPPLRHSSVRAEDAAWRAVGATLLDLSEQDVLELEPHSLPTPGGSVHVLAVRMVRPLPPDDEFASRLLRPLARRGVGASTTVSELVSQLLIMHRHPARSLLESAQEHLIRAGFYHPAVAGVAFLRPLVPDPERVSVARSDLQAMEDRLAAWDERDPEMIAALRDEILAAFVRARARARRSIG